MLRYLLPGSGLRHLGIIGALFGLFAAASLEGGAGLERTASAASSKRASAAKKRSHFKKRTQTKLQNKLAVRRDSQTKLPPLRDGKGGAFSLGQKAAPPPLAIASAQAEDAKPKTGSAKAPMLSRQAKKGTRLRKGPPTDEELLEDAQSAYIRGERQRAIDLAMSVAEKNSAAATAAWRFIGLAACSVRSQRLATRAYQNLRSPGDQRTISDACRHNGLSYREDRFVGE